MQFRQFNNTHQTFSSLLKTYALWCTVSNGILSTLDKSVQIAVELALLKSSSRSSFTEVYECSFGACSGLRRHGLTACLERQFLKVSGHRQKKTESKTKQNKQEKDKAKRPFLKFQKCCVCVLPGTQKFFLRQKMSGYGTVCLKCGSVWETVFFSPSSIIWMLSTLPHCNIKQPVCHFEYDIPDVHSIFGPVDPISMFLSWTLNLQTFPPKQCPVNVQEILQASTFAQKISDSPISTISEILSSCLLTNKPLRKACRASFFWELYRPIVAIQKQPKGMSETLQLTLATQSLEQECSGWFLYKTVKYEKTQMIPDQDTVRGCLSDSSCLYPDCTEYPLSTQTLWKHQWKWRWSTALWRSSSLLFSPEIFR